MAHEPLARGSHVRQSFLITYDISDPRRLRAVYKLMRGWGDHLQLSVFQCELNATERVELESGLSDIIQHDADQVLFVKLGPARGRGRKVIQAIGRTYHPPQPIAVVL
jgi:CRISPR-associated protein Cas2